jgi:histidine triad (HIT) family protein
MIERARDHRFHSITKTTVRRCAFAFARSRLGKILVPWIFAHMSFALPAHCLRESAALLAFHHPSPSYPLHILIVPKRAIPGLADLKPEDAGLLAEVLQMAHSLVQEFGLEQAGYRLIVNGGAYQNLPQLHFHLISEIAG